PPLLLLAPPRNSPRQLAARSRDTCEQSLDAEVLVDVGPMDALAVGDQLELCALPWRRVEEAREPRKRDAEFSPIVELDAELVTGDRDLPGPWHRLRSAHSSPPGTWPREPRSYDG